MQTLIFSKYCQKTKQFLVRNLAETQWEYLHVQLHLRASQELQDDELLMFGQ